MTETELDTPITPVDSWAEVDPDWVPFADPDLGALEESASEDLSEEELAQEPEEGDALEGPRWVRFELWTQNLSEGTERQLASTADFDGPLEVEIGNLPPGDLMRFWVRLIDSNGRHSNMSDPIDLQLPLDLTPPPAPYAPEVSDNAGFVTAETDAVLTGPTPPDMSHLVLYSQQMHPVGDPKGEPGSPVRLTEFRGAGSFTTGRFVDRVPHRMFLTAVDTTGNESPRSEYAYFTPSDPVDTQRIQKELDYLNEERLPALDRALTVGLEGVFEDIAAEAQARESAIERAKRETAEEAQEHYDALAQAAQQAHDEARAAAGLADSKGKVLVQSSAPAAADRRAQNLWIDTTGGANTPKRWSGSSWVAVTDKAATDAASAAASALSAAQAAQSRADQAHSQAGSAENLAQAAMDSASGKNRVFSRTTAPSGTASDGDLWYRWSSTAANRQLMGIWTYENGAWRSMGTLTSQMIPVLDVGSQTVGQLEFDRISGFSAATQHLFVGDRSNLIVDPEFQNLNPEGGLGWSGVPSNARVRNDFNSQAGWGLQVDSTSGTVNINQPVLSANPGDEYVFTADVYKASNFTANELRIWGPGNTATGGWDRTQMPIIYSQSSPNGWSRIEHTFTIASATPRGAVWRLQIRLDNASGQFIIANPVLRRRMAGHVIVDGGIKAVQIDVDDLAANTARMNTLWGGFAAFSEAQIGDLLVNTATAKTINAPLVQSHTQANRGWKLTPAGEIELYDRSGNRVLHGNANGLAVQGTLQTTYSGGAGVTIDRGNVRYYSLRTRRWITVDNAPLIRLADGSGSVDDQPVISTLNGGVVIAPGRQAGSGGERYIDLDGRVTMVSGVVSADFSAGEFVATNHPFRAALTPLGLSLSSSGSPRRHGIDQFGDRMNIYGEMPASQDADHMLIRGRTSFFSVAPTGDYRGSVTYGRPARTGSRWPYVTTNVASSSGYNLYRLVMASAVGSDAGGFEYVVKGTNQNSGNVSVSVMYLTVWGGE